MTKNTLLGAAFGLLAGGFALTALAETPKPATASATACSAEQLAVIDTAYRLAEIRIAEAIAYLDANPQSAHVRRFFGEQPRKMVRLSLTMTQATLPAGRRATPRCADAQCDGAFGVASQQENWIAFCPSFFRTGAEGRDARYGVVIHEASHVAVGTRDAAYYPEGTEDLAKAHPELSPMNAESLELFVELMPR
jgi:hypothetical protein